MSRFVDCDLLASLTRQARGSPRGRQHLNLHDTWADPCQRTLNAILPQSYVRPHRHSLDPRSETLVAACGALGILMFDDNGNIVQTAIIGKVEGIRATAIAVEIGPATWHSVVALTDDAVLLEVKAGPFDPALAGEFAEWAPMEGSVAALDYLQYMRSGLGNFSSVEASTSLNR
ncbi:WbuC family cupin fold metalloprotein [Allosphingosinicella vermicomposti]|uniref:WbuC family cupin fold metalloprotein n=1 Tax=Allosphingosinicella vermicomposti TaxID=614671 RepID=UPI000D0F259B|nr:WbuC family cupin fold metalloprotein [Allosphingosinicella vermicomposti]